VRILCGYKQVSKHKNYSTNSCTFLITAYSHKHIIVIFCSFIAICKVNAIASNIIPIRINNVFIFVVFSVEAVG
jgi:hypothetical protein